MHELLSYLDDDFKRIFKIKAEFDTYAPLQEDILQQYATLIKKSTIDEKLLPLDKRYICNSIAAEFVVQWSCCSN